MKPFPRYLVHRLVGALKISKIEDGTDGPSSGSIITVEDTQYEPIHVPVKWMVKHKPEIGGYLIQHGNGYYQDYCYESAKAFESGYTAI